MKIKKEIFIKLILFTLIFLGTITGVTAHGGEITENIMVIANESNRNIAQNLIDELNLDNIFVYRFKNKGDVEHQLEHVITNPDKRILVISNQDIANEFLNSHKDLESRIIVVNGENTEDIRKGLIKLNSSENNNNNNTNYDPNIDNVNESTVDYGNIILVIAIVGIISGLGIYFMKKY